jgi:hypothetical protein
VTDALPVADTPPTAQPATHLDRVKGFIGDLARPFAIISTSLAASIATVIVAHKVDDFDGAAIFIGAVFAGVGALYGAKSWEVAKASKHAAEIEVAKTATEPKP